MKQISKKALDKILEEVKASPHEESMVLNQFLIDIITEVKKLRHKVSKPRKVVKNEKD